MLTQIEKEYLPLSALVMTYMQTIRFLTDYLNGDTYYKIHHPVTIFNEPKHKCSFS
jgi:hypothetical protein